MNYRINSMSIDNIKELENFNDNSLILKNARIEKEETQAELQSFKKKLFELNKLNEV